MSFLSLSFFFFLAATFVIHWAVPARFRWFTLLATSIFFYCCWSTKLVYLLAATILVSYLFSIAIANAKSAATKKRWLVISVIVLLLPILLFKYLNFTMGLAADISGRLGMPFRPMEFKLALPLGISFYTFQIIGYLHDVYSGKISIEKHLGRFAAFVTFFPKLMSGPIERGDSILPQINSPAAFSYDRAVYGVKQFTLGIFKKVAIADLLCPIVDSIFNAPANYSGMAHLLGAFLYMIQIYCDFSGYSDMAIGSARIMGIDLRDNFRSPYFAQSLQEFWSRWHMSLSTWFRDYLYIPLGGNRKGPWRTRFNLLLTFAASGLWHGANLTFIFWGGIHGLVQVIEKALGLSPKKKDKKAPPELPWKPLAIIRIVCVFTVVMIAWVFFRADTISDAFAYLSPISGAWRDPYHSLGKAMLDIGIDTRLHLRLIPAISFLFVWDYFSLKYDIIRLSARLPGIVRWCIYAVATWAVSYAILMQEGTSQEFIYFKF